MRHSVKQRVLAAIPVVLFVLPMQVAAQSGTADYSRFQADFAGWFPNAKVDASSAGRGQSGTVIDFGRDLGLDDRWVPAVSLAWRPARRHRLRFEWLRADYDSTATLERTLVFNGVVFPAGQPVTWQYRWTTYRAGYQFDVVSRPRGSLGVLLDIRQNDVRAQLTGSGSAEVRETRIPLPLPGLTAQLWLASRFELSGEVTAFWIPDNASRTYGGHLLDGQIATSVNITRPLAVRFGYRAVGLRHLADVDSGTMRLRGVFAAAVVRF